VIEHTPQEAIAEDQAVLGNEYGLAYYHTCQEFWRVQQSWDYSEALYGSDERIHILNSSSAAFWGNVQGILLDTSILGIARLVDSPAFRGDANIGVKYLLSLDPAKLPEFTNLVERAVDLSSFARQWRHKRTAHNDLKTLIGETKLHQFTYESVRLSLISIHDVLRWIRRHYFNSDLVQIVLGDGDCNSVLHQLNAAQIFQREATVCADRGDFSKLDQFYKAWPQTIVGVRTRYESR
jgi:hypothetical protein